MFFNLSRSHAQRMGERFGQFAGITPAGPRKDTPITLHDLFPDQP